MAFQSLLLLPWTIVVISAARIPARFAQAKAQSALERTMRATSALWSELQRGDEYFEKLQETDNFLFALRQMIGGGLKNAKQLENAVKQLSLELADRVAEKKRRMAQALYHKRQKVAPYAYSTRFSDLAENWLALEAGAPSKNVVNWQVTVGVPGAAATRDETILAQVSDVHGDDAPQGFILARTKHLRAGFVYTEIYFPCEGNDTKKNFASGVVAKFVDENSYFGAELTRGKDGRGMVALMRMEHGNLIPLASNPFPTKVNRWHLMGVHFTTKAINVFVDSAHVLQVDFDSPAAEAGAVGLYSRNGEAYFKQFITGPSNGRFALAPTDAFGTNPHNQLFTTVKMSADAVLTLATTAAPVVANVTTKPLNCYDYNPQQIQINDWVAATQLGWSSHIEMGESRLSPIVPMNPNALNHALFLARFACTAGHYGVNIRLEAQSAGGIVFRSDDKDNRIVVIFEENTKSVRLLQQKQGETVLRQLAVAPGVESQFLNWIEVEDSGPGGKLKIFLNHKLIMEYEGLPYLGEGRAGLWAQFGSVIFSNVQFGPLTNRLL